MLHNLNPSNQQMNAFVMTHAISHVKQAIEAFFKPSFDDLVRIRNADCVYLVSANTGPSISTPPQALSAMTLVGNGTMTVADYKRRIGSGVNARNRLRAVAVSTPCGLEKFYDLDLCSEAEKIELLEAVLSAPLICHNAQDFLGYVLNAKPGISVPPVLLDLAVMVRALEPDTSYCLAQMLAHDSQAAEGFSDKNPMSISLPALCHAMGLDKPTTAIENGRLWQLATLSTREHSRMLGGPSHLDVLSERLCAVREIFGAIAGAGDIAQKLAAIQRRRGGDEFFAAFEPAGFELARIHARGLPIDAEGLNHLRYKTSGLLPGLAEDLVALVPALLPLMDTLLDEGAIAGAEVRRALGGYCAQNGFELPRDIDGLPKIGFDARTLSGADTLPGLVAWAALDDCKRERKEASEMLTHTIKKYGQLRMHPVLAVTAVTGRTSCREPNAQGLSKRMKKHVRARPGHAIVEADAGAIEIRIAAAMAVKAFSEAEASGLTVLQDSSSELGYWFHRVKAMGMPLVELLRSGACAHDYLAETLDILRPEAKEANLSMLYLITPGGLHKRGRLRGLNWGKCRAAQIHSGWRDQFPEVVFCALWTQAESQSDQATSALLPVRYSTGTSVQDVWLYRSTTLGGRPLITHDDRILNQIAQGSGATMILKSISDLSSFVKDKVIMSVHDSIVLEVPEALAAFYGVELGRSMSQTISQYLLPYGIPTVVNVAAGPSWGELTKISSQFA